MRAFNLGRATQRVRRRLAGRVAPELRRECTNHEALVEQASDGIFLADLNTNRYTYVNAAGARMLGYTREEILGKTIVDLIPPEELPRLAASKVIQQQGVTDVVEFQLKRKDGAYMPTEVSARILPDGRWQGFVRDLSERKRLERQLKQTVDDFNRAQAVAKVGSWRIDVRTNELVWSDEAYRMFGIPRGQAMTYDAFLACVHPDDRASVDARWKAALHGDSYHVEHRIVVHGETRWVCEDAELILDAQGALLGGIGTVQDITARKQAQEELERAHGEARRLHAELEQVTAASSEISEAVASSATDEMATVLQTIVLQAQTLTHAQYAALGIGGAADRPFDAWVYAGMPPETAAAIGRHPRPVGTLGAVAREGRRIRVKNVHADPAFRGFPAHHPPMESFMGMPIFYRGAPVGNLYLANKVGGAEFTDQDERMIKMLAARVGVAIETATLYSNEALRHLWLQTVIDQMPEGVMLVDDRGRVSSTNIALAKLSCGETVAYDPYGNPVVFDMRFPDGSPVAPAEFPVLRALRRGETTRAVEYLMRTAGGALVPVLVNAAPVRGSDGRIVGATSIVQEISKLKELDQLREEWASIIAHDLRQPISAITLSADLLSHVHQGELPEREAKVIARIKETGRRLSRMVAELLDASQLEARRLTVRPERHDLVALVREIVDGLGDLLKNSPVVLDAPPAGCAVEADGDRVRQIFENLLSNAVKYGAPDAPIRIQMAPREGFAEVTVTNQGAGIPADVQPYLFSRFARSRATRREGAAEGLGLGLYISRGLVEAQGGRMWVESTPHETTSFHFTLPLHAAEERRDEGASRSEQPSSPPP